MRYLLASVISLLLSFSAQAAEPAKAYFSGGCFWCMESEFQTTAGVTDVISGYATRAKYGEAEAVEVTYDPARIGYDKLLEIYWSNVDPLDEGGQFYDRGDHYRTVIFTHSEAERQAALASLAKAEAKYRQKIAVQVEDFAKFRPAEASHQDFFLKNPLHYQAYVAGSGRKDKLKKLHQAAEQPAQ
jgi:methionine-S-sulfoxide reductase